MAAAASAGLALSNAEAFASAGAKTSPLVVHDWSYYQKDFTGFKAYFQKYGVPKYITFNTDQAELARAASGAITYDITHPCIAYIPDWQAAGLIGPIDTTKFEAMAKVNKQLAAPGIVNGKTYGIPWDWGYSTPMYRGDKYVPSSQSWEAVLFDKKLRGKVTMYDEGVAMIKIGALINGHAERQHADAEADQPGARHDDQGQGQHRVVLAVRNAGDAGLHLGQGVGHLRVAGHLRAGHREAVHEERQGRLHAAQGRAAGLDLLLRDRGQAEERGPGLRRISHVAYSAPAMDFLVNAFFTGGSAMTAGDARQDRPEVRQAVPPQLALDGAQAAEGVARASPRRTATHTSRPTSRSSRPDRRCAGRAARPPAPRLSPWQPSRPHLPPRPAPRRRRRRPTLSTYLLLGPALAVLLAFFLAPLYYVFLFSTGERYQGVTKAAASINGELTSFSWDRWRELLRHATSPCTCSAPR